MKKVTINNLKECTEQQVFDFVAVHLMKQRKRSVGAGGFCAYRGYGGDSCAAGCLIPNKDYSRNLEGRDWKMLVGDGVMPLNHHELIISLQNIHDKYDGAFWGDKLNDLAIGKGYSTESFKHLL